MGQSINIKSQHPNKATAVCCNFALAIIPILLHCLCQFLPIYQRIHGATGLLQHPAWPTRSQPQSGGPSEYQYLLSNTHFITELISITCSQYKSTSNFPANSPSTNLHTQSQRLVGKGKQNMKQLSATHLV